MWKPWCTFFAGTYQSSKYDVIGWEFLLTKPINFGFNGKNILCWSKFAIKSIADFCLILGYWPSKNASSDHGINDGFISLAKRTTLYTIGKIILCWPIFAKEPIANFCPFLGYWPSKNDSCDHDAKGELVSLSKPIECATTGKKRNYVG